MRIIRKRAITIRDILKVGKNTFQNDLLHPLKIDPKKTLQKQHAVTNCIQQQEGGAVGRPDSSPIFGSLRRNRAVWRLK